METTTRSTATTETRKVELLPVREGDRRYFFYRASISRVTTPVRGKPMSSETTFEGVATRQAIDAFMKSGTQTIPDPRTTHPPFGYHGTIMALTPEAVEALRTQGFHQEKSVFHTGDFQVKTPLTAIESGKPVFVVDVYGADYQAFDIDGKPLPVCLVFSGTHGWMSADRYDLKKAVDILLARKDVRLAKPRGYRSVDRYGKGYIDSGYEGVCEIQFDWIPTDEDYARAWDKATTHEYTKEGRPSGDDLRRACFDLDMFGLRAGGAAKYQEWHEHDEPPERDEDDYDR